MRTKKVIKESSDATEELIKKLFDISGSYEITPKGLVVKGDIQNKLDKFGQQLEELPFKILSVTGRLTLENCKLKSVKNFPEEVTKLDITNNPIKSLGGLERITGLVLFDASGCGLTDLKGCPASEKFNFKNCKFLTSTEGINLTKATDIDLTKNDKLVDITSLIEYNPHLKTRIKIGYNVGMPLIKVTLLNGRDGYPSVTLDSKSVDTKLLSILTEFQAKGWANAMELARKLNDAGFGSNSKL